jgi:hypothetical protein
MKAILTLFVIAALFNSSFGLDFAFKLPRNKKECFNEPLNPGTLVKGSFQADEADYNDLSVEIFDAAGVPLYTEPFTGPVIRFSYITATEGNTNICIHNVGKKYIKIFFELLTGAEAGDVTEAASDEDLKPIERQLVSMDRLIGMIRNTTSFIVQREEEKLTEADTITTKLYIFSAITVITMAAISFFQIRYLEKFFKAKKLI